MTDDTTNEEFVSAAWSTNSSPETTDMSGVKVSEINPSVLNTKRCEKKKDEEVCERIG
jgi:hypothetical protein